MKKVAIISSITLFSVLLLASCPDFNLKYTLKEGVFYAQNMKTMIFYKVKAEMLHEGEKCEVWAETGSGVTKLMARNIADEYDTKIRSLIVDTFGEKNFFYKFDNDNEIYYFDDILIFANRLTGRNDGKLTILLLDIKDGYEEGTDGAYTAGYFWAGNFYDPKEVYYSNGRDMIYVDTKPGLKEKPEETYATFAHELQHLVNFVTTAFIGRVDDSGKYLIPTDVWVNEGLSAYAEYLYLGKNPVDRCEWLLDNRNTIKNGNNFFVWDNYRANPNAVMDDYATVYLFFRWLYLQAGAVTGLQSRIFFDIGNSLYPDYRAVTEVAKEINPLWEDWETLLRTWFAANHDPANAVYGYKDDLYLQEGRGSVNRYYRGIRIDPIGGLTVSLYPGEGVYSIINNNSFTPAESNDSNPHIRYAGLTAHTNDINTVSPYNENALLTFNANTDNSKGRETGSLTGVPVPAASPTADDSRSAAKRTGPYIIDAWDMLGRDQNKYKLPLPR
jgi:hypothetical protein